MKEGQQGILAVVHFVNQDDPVSDETFGIL